MMEGFIIPQICSERRRKQLIKECPPFLENLDEGEYPGRQTSANLHHNVKYRTFFLDLCTLIKDKSGLDVDISKSWINLTKGKKNDMGWHRHYNCEYAGVYYIKTLPFFSNGTLFKHGMVRSPQNSLLVFPSKLWHTAPTCPFPFSRYTMGMDLVVR
jgi:hypothetical protein